MTEGKFDAIEQIYILFLTKDQDICAVAPCPAMAALGSIGVLPGCLIAALGKSVYISKCSSTPPYISLWSPLIYSNEAQHLSQYTLPYFLIRHRFIHRAAIDSADVHSGNYLQPTWPFLTKLLKLLTCEQGKGIAALLSASTTQGGASRVHQVTWMPPHKFNCTTSADYAT